MLRPGIVLSSTAALDGTVFEKAIIFIAEYNEEGSLGFIINKPFARNFNELQEFRHSKSFPLYEGGPVDNENLFFLHRRAELIADGRSLIDGIYLGGDFQTAVKLINNGSLKENDIKLFIGYCGWDNGQLEEEIAEGSFRITDAADELIFSNDFFALYF
jgi:putative transcriptional regulator